jgi:uncharacterized protein RhaS with RHS repeats
MDSTSNVDLLGHRFYDPVTARFVTRDPIGDMGGPNNYEYALNNSVNFGDPSGFVWWNINDPDFGIIGGYDTLNANNVNFAAGWGDTLTLGATKIYNAQSAPPRSGVLSSENMGRFRKQFSAPAVRFNSGLAYGFWRTLRAAPTTVTTRWQRRERAERAAEAMQRHPRYEHIR